MSKLKTKVSVYNGEAIRNSKRPGQKGETGQTILYWRYRLVYDFIGDIVSSGLLIYSNQKRKFIEIENNFGFPNFPVPLPIFRRGYMARLKKWKRGKQGRQKKIASSDNLQFFIGKTLHYLRLFYAILDLSAP